MSEGVPITGTKVIEKNGGVEVQIYSGPAPHYRAWLTPGAGKVLLDQLKAIYEKEKGRLP